MTDDVQIQSDHPQPRESGEGLHRNRASTTDLRRSGPDLASPASPPRAARAIELQIEELVLNGFEASSRYQIAATIEHELTRLLTEHSAPLAFDADFEIDRLDCGTLELKPGAGAETTARQLAQAIYRGLNR